MLNIQRNTIKVYNWSTSNKVNNGGEGEGVVLLCVITRVAKVECELLNFCSVHHGIQNESAEATGLARRAVPGVLHPRHALHRPQGSTLGRAPLLDIHNPGLGLLRHQQLP